MDEDRLIEIESKLAHQEHLLEELNDALGNQQSQITHLEALCRSLIERLRSLGDAGDGEVPGDERPPHY